MSESNERNFTSIQVSKETRDRLKDLALAPNESYENILIRLLDMKLTGNEVEYLLQNEDCDCNLKSVVDWGMNDEVKSIKYLTKDGEAIDEVPPYVFEDEEFQKKWDSFKDAIESLENIIAILRILDGGDSVRAGNLILSRV
jgi:hypothetical protein